MNLTDIKTADKLTAMINSTDEEVLKYIISKTRHKGLVHKVKLKYNYAHSSVTPTVDIDKQPEVNTTVTRRVKGLVNKPESDLYITEGTASFLWVSGEPKYNILITCNNETKTI